MSSEDIPSSAPPVVNPAGLWLDDVSEGMKIVTATYEVTAEEIIEFASRYDPQVFHTDPERASRSFFAGLAASGWMTAGITMRLMLTSSFLLATGMIGLENTVQWPTATRPGDALHVDITITEIVRSRSRPDRATLTMEYDTLNQDGEVRQHTVGKVLAWQRPEAVTAS